MGCLFYVCLTEIYDKITKGNLEAIETNEQQYHIKDKSIQNVYTLNIPIRLTTTAGNNIHFRNDLEINTVDMEDNSRDVEHIHFTHVRFHLMSIVLKSHVNASGEEQPPPPYREGGSSPSPTKNVLERGT